MPLDKRLMMMGSLVGVSVLANLMFFGYLESAGPLPTIPLGQPLEEVPKVLGEWEGVDIPPAKGADYGDDFLFRSYTNTRTQQQVTLWVTYSSVGEDRGHHPDVCMKVAGKKEDVSVRRTFQVEGSENPIQQFRFLDSDGSQWVFYWHYTMLPPRSPAVSDLQLKYQRMHKRPSSATIEVFAPERVMEDREGAQNFVRLVDRQIHRFVGRHAIRGSQRIPVTVVDEDARPDQ